MSGPIVRKYGFPNFEQIFGKRDLEHGTAEPEGQGTDKPPTADVPGESPPKAEKSTTPATPEAPKLSGA